MNTLWWKLFWRVASRITGAGFVLGGLYAPIFYTLILIPSVLLNASTRENLGAVLGVYLLSVIAGAVFGCIFGTILGAIMGAVQGAVTVGIVRYFFFPPGDEIQFRYTLTASSLVVSLIVSYIYFAKYLSGMSGFMLIISLTIIVFANVWIMRKISDWYLSEVAFTLSPADEFERADAGDEP